MEEFSYNKFGSTKKQLSELKKLIGQKVTETKMDVFLTKNPEIFAFALHGFQTGHHGIVVIPKQQIKAKSKIAKKDYGLIPDFLLAGENSDGYQWWVLEIKGVSHKVFKNDKTGRVCFTDTANKGLLQLLEYIDFCNKYQSTLRDTFNLEDFREPNGLFIIGHEDEYKDSKKKAMKSAWNRMHQKKLEIRSFSWLAREFYLQDQVHDFKKNGNSPSWFR